MNKYLVLAAGQTFLVNADKIEMTTSGTILMFQEELLICALPHGASVIKESAINKPEAPKIHKLN